jgi:hypothetical protein
VRWRGSQQRARTPRETDGCPAGSGCPRCRGRSVASQLLPKPPYRGPASAPGSDHVLPRLRRPTICSVFTTNCNDAPDDFTANCDGVVWEGLRRYFGLQARIRRDLDTRRARQKRGQRARQCGQQCDSQCRQRDDHCAWRVGRTRSEDTIATLGMIVLEADDFLATLSRLLDVRGRRD